MSPMESKQAGEMVKAALRYAAKCKLVFPLNGKVPLKNSRGLYDATMNEATIREMWRLNPGANIGFPTGSVNGVLVVDIDGPQGEATLAELEQQNGPLPPTLSVRTGRGRHFYFRQPSDLKVKSGAGLLGTKLDVKGDGGYVVAPPSIHPETKGRYEFISDREPADAPPWLIEMVRAEARRENPPDDGNASEKVPEGDRNDTLTSMAGKLRRTGLSQVEIEAALLKANEERCDPPLGRSEVCRIAQSIARYEPGKLELTKLTDAENANRLVACEGENLRYCHEMKRWLVWDGCRWQVDKSQRARALMEKTMRQYVQQVAADGDQKQIRFATSCLDTWRITNGLTEAEKKLGVNAEELDSHLYLLTFKNGTLNLKTGEFGPHVRQHLITKMVNHDYDPNATCPRFLEFLERAVGSAAFGYIQKLVGYSLTGDTSEKTFVIVFGEGDTGKTTFLELLRDLFSEHATLLQVDTLMERRGGDGATQEDLAELRGARFATTSELDQERRLSIAMIKRIVQGRGQITAAKKYEHKITFPETHKLWLDTNHLPLIPADEKPVWNRLAIVLFENPIPKGQQNKNMGKELMRDEDKGIIAWAVAGELRRQREGLDDAPAAFTKAKDQWLDRMDTIKQFIDENCRVGEGLRVNRNKLYEAYKATRGGNYVMLLSKFTQRLEALGFSRTRDRRYYQGLALLDPGAENPPAE